MQLPEGFKKISKRLITCSPGIEDYFSDPIKHKELISNGFKIGEHLDFVRHAPFDICDLLKHCKEMGEALEDLLLTNDQTEIDFHKHNQTLEKFKEWK